VKFLGKRKKNQYQNKKVNSARITAERALYISVYGFAF
jgi:hypothetical protein